MSSLPPRRNPSSTGILIAQVRGLVVAREIFLIIAVMAPWPIARCVSLSWSESITRILAFRPHIAWNWPVCIVRLTILPGLRIVRPIIGTYAWITGAVRTGKVHASIGSGTVTTSATLNCLDSLDSLLKLILQFGHPGAHLGSLVLALVCFLFRLLQFFLLFWQYRSVLVPLLIQRLVQPIELSPHWLCLWLICDWLVRMVLAESTSMGAHPLI